MCFSEMLKNANQMGKNVLLFKEVGVKFLKIYILCCSTPIGVLFQFLKDLTKKIKALKISDLL